MNAAPDRFNCLPAWAHRLVAAGGIALVLALAVLSASPQLHRWLHPDADKPGHQCAITLFHHGLVGVHAAVSLIVAPSRWVAAAYSLPAKPEWLGPRYRLLPARGPPWD
jgi:hypothetical protein